MFSHISLPNPGVTSGVLPEELYNQVMNEVNEISSDFHSHSNYNNGLAGNIENQYELQKSMLVLQPYLNEMCKSYTDYWNFYKKPSDFKLTHL